MGPLMLTDGSTRITADEYTPKNSFDTPNIIVPPDSPLSEAIKRARLPLDDSNDYLIKDSGNTIMSSDPSAPIISDVTDDKTDQIKQPHVTEPQKSTLTWSHQKVSRTIQQTRNIRLPQL